MILPAMSMPVAVSMPSSPGDELTSRTWGPSSARIRSTPATFSPSFLEALTAVARSTFRRMQASRGGVVLVDMDIEAYRSVLMRVVDEAGDPLEPVVELALGQLTAFHDDLSVRAYIDDDLAEHALRVGAFLGGGHRDLHLGLGA